MDQLPDEILINIMKYLDTIDLIRLCDVYPNMEHLLRERTLIENVNFSREFKLHNINVTKLISSRLDFRLIRKFNITSLYWIPQTDWLKLLDKLDNLEELYALDTKLSLTTICGKYPNITKLSLTLTENVDMKFKAKVKSLCLRIMLAKGHFDLNLFKCFDQLEELWIFNENGFVNYDILPHSVKALKKLILVTKSFSPFYQFNHYKLFKVFHCSRNDDEVHLLFENLPTMKYKNSVFEPLKNELELSWDLLHRNNKSLSCGPKEAKLLYMNAIEKKDMSNIFFEDLNFGDTVILCQFKYVEAAQKILLSTNASKLKRLHCSSCFFQKNKKGSRVNSEKEDVQLFKKSRVQREIDISDDAFEPIAKNLVELKELEINFCSCSYTMGSLVSYNSIHLFENLEQLTLDVPLLLNGQFLEQILKKCKKLWSLKLSIFTENKKFMLNLNNNLKYANSLRDLCVQIPVLDIEQLFNHCNEINSKKLQRISINCNDLCSKKPKTVVLDDFLNDNEQLIFLYLVIENHTAKQNAELQKILNKHKTGKPAKCFQIKNNVIKPIFPITVHNELLLNYTNVGVVHKEDFYKN